MHAKKIAAMVLAVAVPASFAAQHAVAQSYDYPVCYQKKDDHYDSTRIVLNVKRYSRLTARQTVYEADGKHSFKDNNYNRMAVFDGAIVTSNGDYNQPRGAHLGGESYWVRPDYKGPPSPIEWDCTSPYPSATPNVWYCHIIGGGLEKATPYDLELVRYPDRDPYCAVFQDGDSYYPSSH